MVDAQTHDQSGSAKVTCTVTQVMSTTPVATHRRCGTLIRRFISLYDMGEVPFRDPRQQLAPDGR